ncbi:MAG: hypothetical protein ACRCU5_09410 [Rhizobiaceae bacterium]
MAELSNPGVRKPVAGEGGAKPTLLQRITGAPVFAPVISLLQSARMIEGFAVALFVAVSLFIAAFAVLRPDYNWDMVAYVGTALESRHADPQALHGETWKLIDAGADAEQQFQLKQSHPYNVHQWENPVDFQSQLGMYRVKFGYVFALRALEPVIGLVNAAFVLSIVSSLCLGALCLLWLWRERALQGALVLVPLLMVAGYLPLTTVVAPDMLATFVSIAGLYALYRKHDWLGAALLVAAVAVRPDSLILIIALMISAVLFGWRKLPMITAFVVAFAMSMIVSKLGEHPGWWAHFYFSNVQIQNSMTGFQPDFSLVAMARGYARGLVFALQNNDWPMLLLLLVGCWALLAKAGKMTHPRANALAFACVIGVLGKFTAFPLPDDRFYFVFIAGLALVLISSWKPQFQLEKAA